MRRIGGADGGWELTATIVSRVGWFCLLKVEFRACAQAAGYSPPRMSSGGVSATLKTPQRVSTVLSNGDSNIATGEITGSSIGTLSP